MKLLSILTLATGVAGASLHEHRLKARQVQAHLPTEPGIAANCDTWWDNKGFIPCDTVLSIFEVSLDNFMKWNPTITSKCGNFRTGFSYCIGTSGQNAEPVTTTIAPPPAITTTPTTPDNGIETPSPIQQGMVKNCNKFHLIKSTTTCASIMDYFGLSWDNVYTWNPDVGKDCLNLWTGTWACVGVLPPAAPTTTTAVSNGIATPAPIQDGMTKNCKQFHLVKPTTTCDSILNYFSLTWADFYSWNPAVGKDCLNLWTGTWACVAATGSVSNPAPTTTVAGNGIATPTPIQEGMVKNCNKFHLVKTTTTCASIMNYYSLSWDNVFQWNPAVGKDCLNLWANTYACVGVM